MVLCHEGKVRKGRGRLLQSAAYKRDSHEWRSTKVIRREYSRIGSKQVDLFFLKAVYDLKNINNEINMANLSSS